MYQQTHFILFVNDSKNKILLWVIIIICFSQIILEGFGIVVEILFSLQLFSYSFMGLEIVKSYKHL